MDPDACLTAMLEMAKFIQRTIDQDREVDQGDANALADYVTSLDNWIVKGGFLPARWRPKASACSEVSNG